MVFGFLQQQHSMAIFSSIFFFPIILLILFGLNRIQSKKHNQPPSPPKLPIIGDLHQLGSLPHRSLQSLSRKYGPLMLLHLGSTPTLIVSTAEMAQEVMRTHDLAFSSRPTFTAAKELLYGCTDVAMAAYGEYWRQTKKISVTELLSRKRVQSFAYVREEQISSMIKEIKGSCSTSSTVDITKKFLHLTSSVVSRVAFGKNYIERDSNGSNTFAEMARELPMLLGAFSAADLFPLFGWFDVLTGLDGELKKISRGMDSFFDQVIDDHLNNKSGEENDERKDFVDILLHVQKDCTTGVQISKENIKAIVLIDMYVATTGLANSLEWAMSELVKSPNAMMKAQEEVRRVVGRKMKVEEKDLLQVNYLKCVIKETLRLHPPAPLLIPRESISSTVILQGYAIPPKSTVWINAYAIGRDPNLWENANEFLPERFVNSSIDFKGNDFQLIPFGSGRRLCPGITFANYFLEISLANVLYWFDWEFPGGANEDMDMSENSGLGIHKLIPLHLIPTYHFS